MEILEKILNLLIDEYNSCCDPIASDIYARLIEILESVADG